MSDPTPLLGNAALPMWVLIALALYHYVLKPALASARGITRDAAGQRINSRKAEHDIDMARDKALAEGTQQLIQNLTQRLATVEGKYDALLEAYHALLREVAYLRGRQSAYEEAIGAPGLPVTPSDDERRQHWEQATSTNE